MLHICPDELQLLVNAWPLAQWLLGKLQCKPSCRHEMPPPTEAEMDDLCTREGDQETCAGCNVWPCACRREE